MWTRNDGVVQMPEGLELVTEAKGLRVTVTDYHARDVVIPWEMLHRLEELAPEPEAQHGPVAKVVEIVKALKSKKGK